MTENNLILIVNSVLLVTVLASTSFLIHLVLRMQKNINSMASDQSEIKDILNKQSKNDWTSNLIIKEQD
ncbi:MAG: hypothetical protein NT007_00200 [Candidatus Kapabacteria bacterium]|nr:hypothetical protein [Candidatus Kapabacteria bacterium]